MLACIWIFMNWFGADLTWWQIMLCSTFLYKTLFQGHRGVRNKNFCAIYISKFPFDLDVRWHSNYTYWFDEPQSGFILFNNYSKERTLLIWFGKKKTKKTQEKTKTLMLACIQTFNNQFLTNLVRKQRLVDATFWYLFGRHSLSFKVTIGWEIKTPVPVFEILYASSTCWFVEAHAKFRMHDLHTREPTLHMKFYQIYH